MKLDYNLLKAAALVAPKNDMRYYLNGVRIEPVDDGICIVATDGNVLFAAFQETDDVLSAPVTIPTELVQSETKGAATREQVNLGLHLVQRIPKDNAQPYTFNGYHFTPVEGKFPDWRRVLPAETSGDAAIFNPGLYALAHRAIAIADGYKNYNELLDATGDPSRFRLNGNEPSVLTGKNTHSMVLLMPLRHNHQESKGSVILRGITQ